MKFVFLLLWFFPTLSIFSAVFSYHPSQGDLIGQLRRVKFIIAPHTDLNLDKLAQHYGVSYHELIEANPGLYSAAENHTDQRKTLTVIIPTLFILPPQKYRQGIVINLAELRLYYFPKNHAEVITYPVGLGRSGWSTPLMETQVIRAQKNPIWYVPSSIRREYKKTTGVVLPRLVKPGLDNPLGKFALYLAKSGYLIHGNSDESSVGKFISSGCIRLYNADIKKLFYAVPIGTPVIVLNHSIKAGVRANQLYLEAHKPVALLRNHLSMKRSSLRINSLKPVLKPYLNKNFKINYDKLRQILKARTGIPTVIGEI